jgi:hypothetical protein
MPFVGMFTSYHISSRMEWGWSGAVEDSQMVFVLHFGVNGKQNLSKKYHYFQHWYFSPYIDKKC